MADLKLQELEDQLKRIGCNYQIWGRSEIRELAHVLLPGETVEHLVNGTYEGGFAMLAATDQRVLLIDKKPMYLTLEDVRFDMIAEIDYNHRLLNANVFICTPNKSLRFTAYNHARLRKLFHFVQTRVAEIRQHYTMLQSQQAPMPAVAFANNVAGQVATTTVQQPEPAQQQASTYDNSQVLQPAQQDSSGQRVYQPAVVQTGVYRQTAPIISAYTRLPLMSRQRRFLGSRAMNSPLPSIYQQ